MTQEATITSKPVNLSKGLAVRPLHAIREDFRALADLMADTDNEIPDNELGEQLKEWFANLVNERDDKIKSYCAFIANLTMEAQAIGGILTGFKSETGPLTARQKALDNRARMLRNRLKEFFEENDIKKLKLGAFSPHVCLNSAPTLHGTAGWEKDPATIPARFQKTIVILDKEALEAALEGDAELCPRCGGATQFVEVQDYDGTPGIVISASCGECEWTGEPNATVRFVHETHLRIR